MTEVRSCATCGRAVRWVLPGGDLPGYWAHGPEIERRDPARQDPLMPPWEERRVAQRHRPAVS